MLITKSRSPECQHAHLICNMKLAGPVEIQDCVKGSWVPRHNWVVNGKNRKKTCQRRIRCRPVSIPSTAAVSAHAFGPRNYSLDICNNIIILTFESNPNREFGICSSIFHSTSCLTPPTLSVTLLLSCRDLAIKNGSGTGCSWPPNNT